MTGARKVTIKEPVPVEDDVKTEQDKPEPEQDEADKKHEPELDEIVASAANDPDYNWAPGQPCLTCGARNYKYTVGWGRACSECLDLD